MVYLEIKEILTGRQGLLTQLNENQSVKAELDLLEDGADVYKLVGPVMLKQSKEDALATVESRVEMITKDM